ncbi:MAG: (Fe-S)-binding protein [Pseudomonadota bacterium]
MSPDLSRQPLSGLDDAIRRDALDCVMCGICVPHCPTFSLTGNEADGPRGRISLLLGISQGDLPVDGSVRDHLDACLTCRACEAVCPSGVAYGRLIDNGRARLAEETDHTLRPRAQSARMRWLRDRLLTRRRRLGWAWRVYRAACAIGLGGMARRLGGPLGSALPRRVDSSHRAGKPSAAGIGRGRIGLFIGCTGEAMNAAAARATREVLTAMGYQVVTPGRQVCCGAMHAHGGEPEAAGQLRERNARTFLDAGLEEIVVVGTACRSELGPLESSHGLRIREITEWLLTTDPADWPDLRPLHRRVAIHTPCSQRNHLGQPDATQRLLEHIPGLELLEIEGNDRCCGAAGMNVLLYPEQARALRAPKIESIEATDPDCVVSANVGCATHLAGGTDIPVRQPVELIADALRD